MFATDTNAVSPSAIRRRRGCSSSIWLGVTMTRPISSAASKPGTSQARTDREPLGEQQLERDRGEHGQLGGPERLFRRGRRVGAAGLGGALWRARFGGHNSRA